MDANNKLELIRSPGRLILIQRRSLSVAGKRHSIVLLRVGLNVTVLQEVSGAARTINFMANVKFDYSSYRFDFCWYVWSRTRERSGSHPVRARNKPMLRVVLDRYKALLKPGLFTYRSI